MVSAGRKSLQRAGVQPSILGHLPEASDSASLGVQAEVLGLAGEEPVHYAGGRDWLGQDHSDSAVVRRLGPRALEVPRQEVLGRMHAASTSRRNECRYACCRRAGRSGTFIGSTIRLIANNSIIERHGLAGTRSRLLDSFRGLHQRPHRPQVLHRRYAAARGHELPVARQLRRYNSR